jgi:hypothetical protein
VVLVTVKDQVFVYCLLLYEGNQDSQLLKFLPEARAAMIQKEAKRYDRFPKEVRLTLVTKLLGYIVQHVRNRSMERIHPSWIAKAIEKESHQVLSIILTHFSPDYRRRILENFTKTHLLATPYLPPKASEAIFQIFSLRFEAMSAPWGENQLTLTTLFLLKEEEMFVFLKHAGVREIARAFSVAGKQALAALVTRFPPDLQGDFLNGIKSATSEGTDRQKLAAKRLGKIDIASLPMEEATTMVAAIKLGACFKEDKQKALRTAQRLPYHLGMILLEAREEMEAAPDDEQELVSILRDLIEKKKIDQQNVSSMFSSAIRGRPSGTIN